MEFLVFLAVVALAWLIAPIILLIALIVTRNKLKILQGSESAPKPSPVASPPPPTEPNAVGQRQALIDLEHLVLLRLELQRQAQAGNLGEAQNQQLNEQIDEIWGRHLAAAQATPDSETWQKRRRVAWNLLTKLATQPPGTPPWHVESPAPAETPQSATDNATISIPPATTPLEIPPPPVLPEPPVVPSIVAPSPIVSEPAQPPQRKKRLAKADDWQPAEPSQFELLLQRISGWPKLAVPFLLQNIGWFIGAFCLLAGTVFLVRNTSGFWLALVVFTSMVAYTGLLLWSGYQIRVKRPELVTASSVLLGTSMLLAPLDLAAAARLLTAADSPLLLGIGLVLTAMAVAAFYWAASLVSPLMDRSLAGLHPRLVVILAALQLATPLLSTAPHWLWLASIHTLLLVLLGYGLHAFTSRWVQAWFVEQRRTAYYAGGVLVYAAAVSFVHLTWVFSGSLPVGYFGPFLMVLSGLLFQVDAAFKDWVVKFPVLSRFSFGLYGLSVLAAVLGLADLWPGIITLSLGAVLYGWMTWRYLTLPPLYLMLACLSGTYALLVLEPLAYELYLLASLPGLLCLAGLTRWAQTRSMTLAHQCLAVTGVLLTALTVWSLFWAQPGWVGLATPVITSTALYWLSRRFIAPLDLLSPRLEMAVWFLVTLLATAAAFYAPPWPFSGQWLQVAFICTGLAALWTWSGLRGLQRFPQRGPIFLLSAWLNILLAAALGSTVGSLQFAQQPLLILLLAAGGGVLLWQSLVLRRRSLFYAVLLYWGGAGALLKMAYLPSAGTGLSQFLLVLPLWAFLWWLNARFPTDTIVQPNIPKLPVHPLNRFFTPQPIRPAAVVRKPLAQAMALLWLIGCVQLVLAVDHDLPFSWPWSAGLGSLASGLVLGHFQMLLWIAPVPLLLALGAVLGWLAQIGTTVWFGSAAALFAWSAWWSGMRLLAQPLTPRLANALHFLPTYPPGNRRRRVEWGLYGFTIGLTALVPPFALLAGLFGEAEYASLMALVISLGCFAATGLYYRSIAHSYAVLVTLTITVWLVDAWLQPSLWIGIGQASANALLSLALAASAWVLEHRYLASRIVHALYHRPLNRMAVILALLAVSYGMLYAVLVAGLAQLEISDGVVLLAAGGALLLANRDLARFHWGFIGVFLITLACYGLILLVWIGSPSSVYSGLLLAGLAMVEASLANYLDLRDGRWALYSKSLYANAGLAFSAGLVVASLGFLADDTRLPLLLALLSIVLLPLLKPLATAPFWRSIGIILLLSGAFYGTGLAQNALLVMAWGYGLWLIGNVLLPGFNARFAGWALDETPWPWFGLIAVLLGSFAGLLLPNAALFALGLALYLLLMIRNSVWAGFPWAAVGALTLTGLLLGGQQAILSTVDPWSLLTAADSLITLLWLNLILLAVPLWRRYGTVLAIRWLWLRDDLEQPLIWLPFAVMLAFLAQWVMAEWLWLQSSGYWAGTFGLPLLSAAALTLSLAHVLWVQPRWLQAHALLVALYALLPTFINNLSGPTSLLPPLSAMAYGLVLLAWRYRISSHAVLSRALEDWTVILPISTGLLLLLPELDWTTRAVTLAILALVMGMHGWWKEQRLWLALAMALPLAASYAWLATWITAGWIPVLPWAALQTVIYAWILLAAYVWLERRSEKTNKPALSQFRQLLAEAMLGLPYLPVVLLGAYTLMLFGLLLLSPPHEIPWLFGASVDTGAAIAAFALLIGMTVYLAWRRPDRADWVYATTLVGLLLLGFIRLITIGPTPFTVLDSGVLIALAFVALVIQRISGSLPVHHVALLLPVSALLTLPILQTAWYGDWSALLVVDGTERLTTSGVLLAIAVLYIALSERLRNPLPVYLGVLALNAGIYLWIPQWANRSGLWLWYVIPAAVTVLALLHWHRRELRPAVLNGGRLAALSLLYASIGADVLQQQTGLGVFVLALGLNLLGIAVGIALRIRAFLYTGVAFLVLNVGGQLIQYYPEQGLARALVLIGVGVFITVGMVGFNIKREAIMQRVRIIRADLADWA